MCLAQATEIGQLKQEKSEIASSKADELAQLNKEIEKMKIVSKPRAPSTPKMNKNMNTNDDVIMSKIPTTPSMLSTPVVRRAPSSKDSRTPKLQLPKTPKNSMSQQVSLKYKFAWHIDYTF